MNPNQPISMIGPSHVAAQGAPGNYQQPGKIAKNKTLIIVIAASVIFLVVLERKSIKKQSKRQRNQEPKKSIFQYMPPKRSYLRFEPL